MPDTSRERPGSEYRPSLLYVSPVLPALTGNGLAMRAGAVLRALAAWYRVTLLVELRYPGDDTLAEPLCRVCERVVVVGPGQPTEGLFPGERFDVVHVFRLAALSASEPYLAGAARRHLDLDDLESDTRRRLAELYRANGEAGWAEYELTEAEQAERVEHEVMRAFDVVYICSEEDRRDLAGRGAGGARAEVRVMPNTFAVQGPLPPAPGDGPFTFLFIGTLGYYPNADGLRWWCAEVLPRLRMLAPVPFRLVVVGTGAEAAVGDLGALPEVEVVGRVPDVAEWYQRAHAVVVPIRAGGGTRIKLLEAFSFRQPAVTTTVGGEGLDARDGHELLIADTPDQFAEQCARLMTDAHLRVELAEAGVCLLVRAYLPSALAAALRPAAPADEAPDRACVRS